MAQSEHLRVNASKLGVNVSVREAQGVQIFGVTGEVDICTIQYVREESEKIVGPKVCDLREVTYFDSSGVNWLLQEIQQLGRQMVILASPNVQHVLEIVGLTRKFIAVCTTEEEAIATALKVNKNASQNQVSV